MDWFKTSFIAVAGTILIMSFLVGCTETESQSGSTSQVAAGSQSKSAEEPSKDEDFDPLKSPFLMEMSQHFGEEGIIIGSEEDADLRIVVLDDGKIQVAMSEEFLSHFPDGMLLDLGLGVPEAEFSREGYSVFIQKLDDYLHTVDDHDHDHDETHDN